MFTPSGATLGGGAGVRTHQKSQCVKYLLVKDFELTPDPASWSNTKEISFLVLPIERNRGGLLLDIK